MRVNVVDILQDQRGAKILTVLGPDALVLRSLSFDETLNADFEGHVEVLSTNFNIDPREMIGQFVTIELETMLGPRYFNAVASKFQYAGAIGRHALYEIRLTPWMQLLTLRQDCRFLRKPIVKAFTTLKVYPTNIENVSFVFNITKLMKTSFDD